jgi:hypothetical protein
MSANALRSDPERQKALTGSLIGACSAVAADGDSASEKRLAARLRWPDPGAQRSRARHAENAGSYITKLPKAEHETPEWQAAAEALLLGAERDGPTMLARIGIMGTLNRHGERVFEPSGKKHHWGKRKLARDR